MKNKEAKQMLRVYTMHITQQLEYFRIPIEDLKKLIEKKLHPKLFAFIVHDKDEGVASHIHIILRFDNARYISSVAKTLKIEPQFIEKWDDRTLDNAFAYLIHRTTNAMAEGKYQYEPSEVIASFDFIKKIEQLEQRQKGIDFSKAVIDGLIDAIVDGSRTMESVKEQLPANIYIRNHILFEKADEEYKKKAAEEWIANREATNEPVRTLWVYGPAGVGKTSLSKKIASSITDNYYISGSSKDPFQSFKPSVYSVAILDELRPNTIPFEDLLKILDPYNYQKNAPSRYNDKWLGGVSCFIITTCYSPIEFYNKIFDSPRFDQTDSFGQLNRRISTVIKMEDETFFEVVYQANKHMYVKRNNTVTFNIYSEMGRLTTENIPQRDDTIDKIRTLVKSEFMKEHPNVPEDRADFILYRGHNPKPVAPIQPISTLPAPPPVQEEPAQMEPMQNVIQDSQPTIPMPPVAPLTAPTDAPPAPTVPPNPFTTVIQPYTVASSVVQSKQEDPYKDVRNIKSSETPPSIPPSFKGTSYKSNRHYPAIDE